MRYSAIVFAFLLALASGCEEEERPDPDETVDPCADGGTGGKVDGGGFVTCDGLPPITTN